MIRFDAFGYDCPQADLPALAGVTLSLPRGALALVDAETGEPSEEVLHTTVGALLDGDRHNLRKGHALMAFADVATAWAMRADPCGAPLQAYRQKVASLGDDAEGSVLYACEIADDIVQIDQAMRWGFGWELGPFEIWDAIGVERSVRRMKAEGKAVPALVTALEDHSEYVRTEAARGLAKLGDRLKQAEEELEQCYERWGELE